jgi:hypothetical protein
MALRGNPLYLSRPCPTGPFGSLDSRLTCATRALLLIEERGLVKPGRYPRTPPNHQDLDVPEPVAQHPQGPPLVSVEGHGAW